jgi:hypothetical protein
MRVKITIDLGLSLFYALMFALTSGLLWLFCLVCWLLCAVLDFRTLQLRERTAWLRAETERLRRERFNDIWGDNK